MKQINEAALKQLVIRWNRQADTDARWAAQSVDALSSAEGAMASYVWARAARELAELLPADEVPKPTVEELADTKASPE